WRMIDAAADKAASASGRSVALSKSKSTSAASSMRTSVSVSLTSRSAVLPPTSSTLKTTSRTFELAPGGRSGFWARTAAGSARNGSARNSGTTRRPEDQGMVGSASGLAADRDVVHRGEVRDDDRQALDVVGRRRELRPVVDAAAGGDGLELAAHAVLRAVGGDEVLLLADGVAHRSEENTAEL